jgi:CelD/BcsL family acetyltransferase involved in cellulose biosynthesis
MAIALNLEAMSVEEKVEAMEALWRDLSAQAGYESPLWHKEVLEARENAPSVDWREAKKRIRKRTCE